MENTSVCVVCYEEIDLAAIYNCNHIVCYKCASRLIFLAKTNRCAQCNDTTTEMFKFKFIEDNVKDKSSRIINKSKGLIINQEDLNKCIYENSQARSLVKALLGIICGICSKVESDTKKRESSFSSIKHLKEHLHHKHQMSLCDICIERSIIFTSEYEYYSKKELSCHLDSNHKCCKFCDQYFYDHKEIIEHSNKVHFLCSVCDVIGLKYQYFRSIETLEKHYRKRHFCCDDLLCIRNHCFAFPHRSELAAHNFNIHGKKSSYPSLLQGKARINLMTEDIKILNDVSDDENLLDLSEGVRSTSHTSEYVHGGIRIETCLLRDNPEFPQFKPNKSSNELIDSNPVYSPIPNYLKGKVNLTKKELFTYTKKDVNVDRIYTVIEEYLQGNLLIEEFVNQLKDHLTEKEILKIFTGILYSINEIVDYIPKLKEEVKFPKFISTSKKKENISKDDSNKKKVEVTLKDGKLFKRVDLTK